MLTVEEVNTFLVKITPPDSLPFDQNDFIELFLDDAPFAYLRDSVFGISIHNYQNKIYTLNFIPDTDPKLIETFFLNYQNPRSVNTIQGFAVTVTVNTPQKPLHMVTLYPMPFAISHQQLLSLTSSWGKLEKYDFGRHKRFPNFRNAYLRLYFKDPNLSAIPDTIKVNNRFVTVMMQGEEHLFRCGYCKAKNHTTPDCPVKPSQSRMQHHPRTSVNQNHRSYANTVANTKPVTASSLSQTAGHSCQQPPPSCELEQGKPKNDLNFSPPSSSAVSEEKMQQTPQHTPTPTVIQHTHNNSYEKPSSSTHTTENAVPMDDPLLANTHETPPDTSESNEIQEISSQVTNYPPPAFLSQVKEDLSYSDTSSSETDGTLTPSEQQFEVFNTSARKRKSRYKSSGSASSDNRPSQNKRQNKAKYKK